MKACTARRFHRPTPLSVDEHHVVPQAWQRFWQPGDTRSMNQRVDSALGIGHDLPALWAPDTVTLCPTCHRNVHHHLVALMKLGAEHGHIGAVEAYPARGTEVTIAVQGMLRFVKRGGSLDDLRTARLYGAA